MSGREKVAAVREEARRLGVPVPHQPHREDVAAIIEVLEAVHAQEGRLMLFRHRIERDLTRL